jgi:hypothetical protein
MKPASAAVRAGYPSKLAAQVLTASDRTRNRGKTPRGGGGLTAHRRLRGSVICL